MSNNDSSNSARAQTMDQDSAGPVLPLGSAMKETMLEWYEYHIRLCDTPGMITVVVALADITADNPVAKDMCEGGAREFGIISTPLLKDIVSWVSNGTQIRMGAEDFGPHDCFRPVCRAVLGEFFRDIRKTKPELESIFMEPLPQWMEICWKGRAECTGHIPIKGEDSIH